MAALLIDDFYLTGIVVIPKVFTLLFTQLNPEISFVIDGQFADVPICNVTKSRAIVGLARIEDTQSLT